MRAGREAAVQRDEQLAAGRNVEVQPFLVDEPRHRDAQKRLAGVGRAVAEPFTVRAAAAADLGLVVHVARRAEALRELGQLDAADRHPARAVDGARGRQQRKVERRHCVVVVLVVLVVEARHLVGRVHAEQRERVGKPDAARFGQPQAGLRQLRVVGEHAAVVVEAVEHAGEVAHPRRDLLRRTRLGGFVHRVREHRERAQQLLLALVGEQREIDVAERPPLDARGTGLPRDRRDAGVRHLHVVDGVLHRLLGHDVEVERLRGVDAVQQERHARDVGVDAVEDVGERDDVPGPPRHPHFAAVLDDLHVLAENDLGLTRGEAERLHAPPAGTSPGRGDRRPTRRSGASTRAGTCRGGTRGRW